MIYNVNDKYLKIQRGLTSLVSRKTKITESIPVGSDWIRPKFDWCLDFSQTRHLTEKYQQKILQF